MKPTLILAVALAVVPGCLQLTNVGTKVGTVGGPWSPITHTDVLLVIDDSGSLAGEQQRLKQDAHDLVTAITDGNKQRVAAGGPPVGYRFAVTTTSVTQRWVDSAGQVHSQDTYEVTPGYDCHSSYLLPAGDPYPAGAFVSPSGLPPILDSQDLSPGDLEADLQRMVQVGVCGSGQEQGLLAMDLALQKHPNFPAPGARLVVVLMSDEEDCSDPNQQVALGSDPSGDACVAEAAKPDGGALLPVSHYAAPLLALPDAHVVAIADLVHSAATGNLVPGVCDDPACDAACGTGDPTGFPCYCGAADSACQAQCKPSNAHAYPCYCGGTSPGSRYLKLVDEVPGSVARSICGDGIAQAMQRVAGLVTGASQQ